MEAIKEELKKHTSFQITSKKFLVPTHQVTEVKKGKRTKKEKQIFSRVCINKNRTDETNISFNKKSPTKVSGFLGSSGYKPTPISDNENYREY